MQTDTNPWRVVQFVSSPEAYELVRELQGVQKDEPQSDTSSPETSDTATEEEDADDLFTF